VNITMRALRCGHKVAGADGLHWNSRLEIKGETLRLIDPSCERTPRWEQDKAVSARIGAYTLRQI
jgi:hypothetical protein